MTEYPSGIEGMQQTLALHLERMRENPETIPSYEWVQLATSYARLAELERDAVALMTERRSAPEHTPGGPSGEWSEYLPNRIVRDVDNNEWFVMGYTHDGMPFLGVSLPSRESYNANTAQCCTDRFGPLVVTDSYMK